ncbi:MAG: hypothetical protein H0W20_03950 [Chthoniobacterales bacterium]|nr:hypothetical protein [Chthoniobacterales bacterium]
MTSLFEEYRLPAIGLLRNRVVMSAMTRSFADAQHHATPAMSNYYRRRAEGGVGLILTEGVIVHHTGDGYHSVPHLETMDQAESWKPVIAAVHEAGAKIVCQLWHCGRISHSDFTGGVAPVSSTALPAAGINRQNNKPFGVPVALTHEGIAEVHEQHAIAAVNALAVGFDGVQLHFAHGYLTDQFFDARINQRSDRYGGSVENRCRFGLELLERVLACVPAERVCVRLSPSREMRGLYDWPELEAMLAYLIPALARTGLRFLDISCANADYYQTSGRVIRMLRPHWPRTLMGGASLTPAQAEQEISAGLLDLVTWGRHLLANPDLIAKFKSGEALVEFEPSMLKDLL